MMHEPEADAPATPWGIFDQIFSNNYYGDASQHEVTICREQYVRDSYADMEQGNIDQDEIIAHSLLQEELSQLAIEGSPEHSHAGDEYLQNSLVPQNWQDSSNSYYIGQEDDRYENDDGTSACSSPGDISCDADEYIHDLEITDEYELDGEVEKRLNQMNPIPHIPRINGDIPSVDEATSDHQRLLDRLQLYDLIEHKVQGDGNCQFRALSDQFYRSPEHHKFVRKQVVRQLKAHPTMYEGYVPMEYADYLKRMSKDGEWGDHVTLQAAADSYGLRILVVTSFKDTCYIEILPKEEKSKRVIYLSFWAEVHYNSIYPQGDLPPIDFKRKKKWWNFRNKS